jgi:putative transposase
VCNTLVVKTIRDTLEQEFCMYGYQMMTWELRALGYEINPKKVYRLMAEERLLCGQPIRTQGKRNWVKFRRIKARRPMEYLCLDIRHVWVHGDNRWYYQLSIIDVYSRRILGWIFQRSVRQKDVIALMRMLNLKFDLEGVFIRNDNGSQFLAKKVRDALREMEAVQEFTHVATPQENSYIEAFHSIQQRELIDNRTFHSYDDAKGHIERYMFWYNCKRRHGRIRGRTPMEKWVQGFSCPPRKPPIEPGSGAWSRPGATEAPQPRASALYSLDQDPEPAYLRLGGDQLDSPTEAKPKRKSVQLLGG